MKRITGWTLIAAGLLASLFVAYEASTLPLLRGAGLAQADFELFVAAIVVGTPAVVASVAGSFILRRLGGNEQRKTGLFREPSILATTVTIVIVVLAIGFALLIRQFGFFWK